jgi:peptide/nickel transport system permease protein
MSQTTTQVTAGPDVQPVANRRKSQSRGFFLAGLIRFLNAPLNVISLVVFVIITAICYSAGFIATNIVHQERDTIDFNLLTQGFQPPVGLGVGGHLLGTDNLGRDLLVRILYGGQVSITVGLLAAIFSVFVGTTLGLIAGYFGGKLDDGINALVQIIFNVPSLFLLIILSLFFKPDILSLSIIIGILSWPGGTRQIRGQVLSLRNREYVDAARVMGASNVRILLKHILPNVVSTMLVVAGFDIVGAMLTESGLSYLGFGISVPIPSWGNMLSDSQLFFTTAPWMVYAPAIAFFITVLCVYLIADGLRDAFDPRLRER